MFTDLPKLIFKACKHEYFFIWPNITLFHLHFKVFPVQINATQCNLSK